jgi:hypothetical protein
MDQLARLKSSSPSSASVSAEALVAETAKSPTTLSTTSLQFRLRSLGELAVDRVVTTTEPWLLLQLLDQRTPVVAVGVAPTTLK